MAICFLNITKIRQVRCIIHYLLLRTLWHEFAHTAQGNLRCARALLQQGTSANMTYYDRRGPGRTALDCADSANADREQVRAGAREFDLHAYVHI